MFNFKKSFQLNFYIFIFHIVSSHDCSPTFTLITILTHYTRLLNNNTMKTNFPLFSLKSDSLFILSLLVSKRQNFTLFYLKCLFLNIVLFIKNRGVSLYSIGINRRPSL